MADAGPTDVPDMSDIVESDAEFDAIEAAGPPPIELVIPTEPVTPLRPRTPALVDDLMVVVDALGIRTHKLGLPPIILAEFAAGTEASSPVIVEGLNCWDIDGDGVFTPAKEDFNADGVGTAADCEFHPPSIPTGARGVVVAVHPPGGVCELRAYTLVGEVAWTTPVDGDCQQPAQLGRTLILPVTVGSQGTVRLVSIRDGSVGNQVVLPGAPTTPPARLDESRFIIGYAGGIAILTASGFPAVTSLFVGQKIVSLDTERATTVFPVGPQVVAAVFHRNGDPPQSLGRRIRQYDLDADLHELPGTITTPSALWGPPAAAFIDGGWSIAAGGAGWIGAFEADSGAIRFLIAAELGTVTGVAIGGDGRVYASEVSWKGDPEVQGGVAWMVWSINPGNPESKIFHLNEDELDPVRWVSAPTLLCDLLVSQVVLDAELKSIVEVGKPCSSGLADGSWARPFGDNTNTGSPAVDLQCDLLNGFAACIPDSGCTINSDCDDESQCTIDSCVSGFCAYKIVPNCCTIDAHCNDNDECTLNECNDGKCVFTPSDACCESSSECDDDKPCTVDACEQGFCEHVVDPKKPGCCTNDGQCVDGTPCTDDFCNFTQTCENKPVENCCLVKSDCLDFDACTADSCVEQQCVYTPSPEDENCCQDSSECDDQNPCTEDVCIGNNCFGEPIEGCCNTDEQCGDDSQCTIDTCVLNACEHEVVPTLPGCCESKEECKPPEPISACVVDWVCTADALCEIIEIDCDDEDECTEDECVDGQCVYADLGCCTLDSDCEDELACTIGICGETGICGQLLVDNCCENAADCADDDSLTSESCIDNICTATFCEDYEFTLKPLQVDIVVVVDQSTSMTDEIPLIQDYLNSFANFAGSDEVDFHVILVASRYLGQNAICVPEPLAGPNCADSENFIQISQQVSSHNALQLVMDNIATAEAFMRPGSSRHFLVFSDDFSNVLANDFDFFLATRAGYDNYTFHSVTGFATTGCATGLGTEYQILADMSGGLQEDICGTVWTSSYQSLADVVITANASFVMPYKPVDGSITVVYDMTPLNETTGWVWDPALDRITLVPPYPDDSAPVTVCFEILNFSP